MPVTIGPTIEDGLWDAIREEIYYEEPVISDPENVKAGESVTSHSPTSASAISIETKAAPPKTGAMVSEYRTSLLMEILGELG